MFVVIEYDGVLKFDSELTSELHVHLLNGIRQVNVVGIMGAKLEITVIPK